MSERWKERQDLGVVLCVQRCFFFSCVRKTETIGSGNSDGKSGVAFPASGAD